MLPSLRPEHLDHWRPQMRHDLRFEIAGEGGERHLVVHDAITRQTHHLHPRASRLVRYLDGEHSLAWILASEPVEAPELLNLIADLDRSMLLHGPRLAHRLARLGALDAAEFEAGFGLFHPRMDRSLDAAEPAHIEHPSALRFACRMCGMCCTQRYRAELTEADAERLRGLDLEGTFGLAFDDVIHDIREEGGASPFALKQPQGRCIFLADSHHCELHRHFGEASKPATCRAFPFSVILAPNAGVLRYRPECSSQYLRADAPQLSAEEARMRWLSMVAELDVVPEIPPVFPARGEQWTDYATQLSVEARWMEAIRSHGWREALSVVMGQTHHLPSDEPRAALLTLVRMIALGSDRIGATHSLDRIRPGTESDPTLVPTLAMFQEAMRAEDHPARERLASILEPMLETLDALSAHDTQMDTYLCDAIAGKYLFSGLSITSGLGLVVLVVVLARRTAAWMVGVHGCTLDDKLVNACLIHWHIALFNEMQLRRFLLVRCTEELERLPGLPGEAF